MIKQRLTGADIDSLMDMLASEDGMIRENARESLIALGKHAVQSLTSALQNSTSDQVRWEAAKALGTIGDRRSIPALVQALSDTSFDVTWLAAEALSTFKQAAWPPLLNALMDDESDSDLLRKGVHHVLLNQSEDGFDDLLETLRRALEPSGVRSSAVVAAYEILKRMKATS